MGAAGLGSLQGVPGHWPLTAGATCAGGASIVKASCWPLPRGEVSPLDPLARARRGPGRRRRLAVGPAGRRAGRLCLDLPPGLASDLGEPHGLALELAGLILILEGQVSLTDALDMKIDKAAQEGIIFFPCASAPCKAALGCQIDSSEVSRCLNEELVKLPIAS